MIIVEKREITRDIVVGKQCDVCKKTFSYPNDEIEIQEFWEFGDTGGYGSIFGDGCTYRLDMCQHCAKKLLGDYIRYEEY